ncbi:MAG: hypothetical protein WC505_05980 [Patescibacteria group bacterium]
MDAYNKILEEIKTLTDLVFEHAEEDAALRAELAEQRLTIERLAKERDNAASAALDSMVLLDKETAALRAEEATTEELLGLLRAVVETWDRWYGRTDFGPMAEAIDAARKRLNK